MYTIEQYNALSEAISQGALRVRYGDKEVEYRSLDEMLKIKNLMENQLFGNKNPNNRTYATFSKGIK